MNGVRGIHKFNGGHIGVSNIDNTFGGMWSVGETANPFTAIFPTFGATYEDIVKQDLPIAYWKLDETNGATAVDQMGNYDGTYVNSPTLGVDPAIPNGSAVEFPNADQSVEAPSLGSISFPFTIEAWVRHNSDSDIDVVYGTHRNSNAYVGAQLWIWGGENNTAAVTLGNGSGDSAEHRRSHYGSTPLTVDVWYHVVVVCRGLDDVDIWLDGKQETVSVSGTASSFDAGSNEQQLIASSDTYPDHRLNGAADEIAYYDRALTATEIRRHYYAGLGYSGYALETLTNGPVAYWRLDEESGTTAADETGNNDGTYEGSPTLQQSSLIQSGNSVQFDGTDDYIAVSDSPFDFGTTDFSIAAWINLNSIGPFHTIAHHRDVGGTGNGYLFGIRDTGVLAAFTQGGNDSGEVTSSTALVSGQTYFVVATWDRDDNVTLYINGNQDSTLDISGIGDISASDNLRLGWSTSSNTAWEYFDGLFDEPAIFDSVLTHEQIMDMYIAGKQYTGYAKEVLETLPVAYWKFDEESGTTAVSEVGGHDGTINGNPTLNASPLIQNGTAFEFDGSGDYIETEWDGPLSTERTFDAWLKIPSNAPDNMTYLSYGTDANGDKVVLHLNSGRVHFGVGGGAKIFTTDLRDNLTHHVVVTVEGNTTSDVYVFIDAVEDASSSDDAVTINTTAGEPIRIGRQPWDTAFDFEGTIDEPAIYDRALTATEIRRHYYAGLGYSGYPLSVLSGGPVAYWRLDEESGTTANDETGNHDGTYNGSPTLTASPLIQTGTAVELNPDFDSSDGYINGGYIEVPDHSELHSTNLTDFALETWMQFAGLEQYQGIVIKRNQTTTDFGLFYISGSDSIEFEWGDGNRWQTSFSPAVGTKYHLAVTRDSNGMELYVNGELQDSTSSTGGTSGSSNSALHIGSPGDDNYTGGSFYGVVDDVAIYDRALTATEIEEHYSLGRFGV